MGMRRRLLLAQTLVLLAGGLTTGLVAAVVGPPLFRDHLHMAGVPANSDEQIHAEEAYRSATAISIAIATTVAVLTAFVVTAYLSRRLQRSLSEVSAAASAVAQGHYGIRVTAPRLGEEFDELAIAFNEMAERLQSVDSTRRRMFGDLAHEIRTPVAVLEAYLEAVEDGVKIFDSQTITMLREQTGRLVRFSADAAALAQAEEVGATIDPDWVDADDLVAAVSAAYADRYAAKNVALHTRADDAGRLFADRQRVAQILSNLVDNALQYTPAGGHVTLTVARLGPEMVFSVADDGEGVSAEHLPHLFERFYRADFARDRVHGGSGIGLAIVKAFTEAHGGHVTAASPGLGQGCTFTVAVPVPPSPATREEHSIAVSSS